MSRRPIRQPSFIDAVIDAVLDPGSPGPRLAGAAAGHISPDSPIAGGGPLALAGPGDARHSPAGKPHAHDSAYQSQAERSITMAVGRTPASLNSQQSRFLRAVHGLVPRAWRCALQARRNQRRPSCRTTWTAAPPAGRTPTWLPRRAWRSGRLPRQPDVTFSRRPGRGYRGDTPQPPLGPRVHWPSVGPSARTRRWRLPTQHTICPPPTRRRDRFGGSFVLL